MLVRVRIRVRVGTGGFELMNLFLAGNARDAALLNDADQAAAGHASREPCHQLSRVDRLTFAGVGSKSHPKKKQKN